MWPVATTSCSWGLRDALACANGASLVTGVEGQGWWTPHSLTARGRGEEQKSEVGESGEHRLRGGYIKREKVFVLNVATDTRPENTTQWDVQVVLSAAELSPGLEIDLEGAEGVIST